jgi:alpha-galactosidase
MANLPSNTRGILSSEMYTLICDMKKDEDFLVGQAPPFDQFFYIRLNLFEDPSKMNHFELVYDFGRKLIPPGESIDLDGILMAKGDFIPLQDDYFSYVREKMRLKIPKKNITGWSSWYYYYNKISSKEILKNLEAIKEKNLEFDFIEIDDGYQKSVGDWLTLQPQFEGKMKLLADSIRKAGFEPGIWIAPFIAEKRSELSETHPEYLLRDEYGKEIVAGYNIFWPGHWYYGLDITNPRFEEYIRNVIRTLVHEWGYSFLKCDFLFGGCLRGGTHNDLNISRAEVLKRGMKLIREEAGDDVLIVGCGMPLSTGIGSVDIMRIGPDTGPYWKQRWGFILNTGAIVGARNSIRNFMVRSAMHKQLWINDPDCLMIRSKKTQLTHHERMSQINAIILSGGMLLFSDDFTEIRKQDFDDIPKIMELNRECFEGDPIPIDLMDREIPEVFLNTSGYLGVFNFTRTSRNKTVNIKNLPSLNGSISRISDVWTGEEIEIDAGGRLTLPKMPPHSSRLFKIFNAKRRS